MNKKAIQNQVTRVKTGTRTELDAGGNMYDIPIYTDILNAGKTDRELNALATILQKLGITDGSGDTKNKIENGSLSLREHIMYSYDIYPAIGAGQNGEINLLDESKTFKRGQYSLQKGNQLQKYRNLSVHGIRISVADAPGGVVGRFKTDIDVDDLTGLLASHLVIVHGGKEVLEIPVSKLVTKTYNSEGFASLDKNLVLLEETPLQIKLKVAASGTFRADIAIKVELIGFTTYSK